MNNLGEFKCPSCGWVHIGIPLEDAQEQVHQAQAFYVVASKINHVATRGPDAYLESYRRCFRCGAPASDFVPALPGDVPNGCTLQAVIAPRVRVCRDYTFTLQYQLANDDANHDELVERLAEAGCTDARVGIGQPGCIALEFTREAESLRDARESAIADVKRAIPSATLLDDGVQMNDFQIPDDFPRPQHFGAVPGAQTKFLAVEYQGRYYSPGCTPPELYERWEHCMHLVPQFAASCIETKRGKRKDMPEAEILDQYLARLFKAKWVSDDEAKWVIRETARQLGWPTPEAAHGD
jgi:hypothetical protein